MSLLTSKGSLQEIFNIACFHACFHLILLTVCMSLRFYRATVKRQKVRLCFYPFENLRLLSVLALSACV